MVFDENMNDWVPRWGARSIKKNDEKNTPLLEVKKNSDPYEDPFLKRSLEKSLAKERQKMNEIRNKIEAKGYNSKEIFQSVDKEDRKA